MIEQPGPDPVAAGRAAVARGAWTEAFDLLSSADRTQPLAPDALPAFADAAYMTSKPDMAIGIWERAHAQALKAGDVDGAANAALRLCILMIDTTKMGPLAAWTRRLDALLADQPEGGLHAGAAIVHSFTDIMTGEIARSLEWAEKAVIISERVGDRSQVALALNAKARALILGGSIREGMTLLEDAAVSALADDLDPFTSGVVYCSTVCACQSIGEYEKAAEWTAAMERWTNSTFHPRGMHGRCRIHRSQVALRNGDWTSAADDARLGAEELRTFAPVEEGWGLSELGSVRLRMGDLDGAQAAFDGAYAAGWDPQPGAALLRLARGDTAGAAASIRDAIEAPIDSPSREVPPNTDLRRAPVLAAQVEIAAANGDPQRARWAADALTGIADGLDLVMLRAGAAVAEGRASLAEGNAASARSSFQLGARLWQELHAPYETARARMGVGEAARALGSDDRAAAEFRAARQAFERLGARLDVRAASEALGEAGVADEATSRQIKVFMFTDIVSSTNLVEAMGDDAWQHLLRWHNETIRALVQQHRGSVGNTTGDGFFVTFDTAGDGLTCAVAIQQALERHRREHGFAPRVRIGLHQAEATREGDQWSGAGVHLAARIGALAEGGQILASRETAEAAGGPLPRSGAQTVSLKGFSEGVQVVRITWAGA